MSYLLANLPLFILLVIAVIIVLILRVHITFNIVVTQNNSVTRVRVGASGLNKIINVGLKTFYNTDNQASDKSLINGEGKINSLFSMPSFKEATTLLHRFKIHQLKKMVCTELSWNTQLGVNDPMGTAMLCGALWGVKYYLIGLLSGKLKYDMQPQIAIQPLYNHLHVNSELKCLIKVRLSQAVWISIKLVGHLSKARKNKKKLERTVLPNN